VEVDMAIVQGIKLKTMSVTLNTGENIKLYYREGSTDESVIRETLDKHTYRLVRKPFDVEPGEVWLDLGANIGIFAVWCGIHGASCYSVEPAQSNYQILKLNMGSIRDVTDLTMVAARAAVVADGLRELKIYHPKQENNHWRYTAYPVAGMKEYEIAPSIPIKALSTPAFIPQLCSRIWDGIKCDIEGGEFPIMDGPGFPPCKKLVLEYHFSRGSKSMDDFHTRMDRLRKDYHIHYHPHLDRMEGDYKGRYDKNIFCWNKKFFSDCGIPK